MAQVWLYTLVSVFLVSLISLIGILTLSFSTEKLRKALLYLVSFSAGALFGDVFIHLLPKIAEDYGFTYNISIYILLGILIFFILEKIIHWHHYHMETDGMVHPFAWTILMGDAFHNLIDGMIIGASYLVSMPVGIATTLAVLLHEIPQEIGDFGVLLHAGFSKSRALFYNFISASLAFLGAFISLILYSYLENITFFLIPIAAGGFIYIAGSDLIPELHKEVKISRSFLQLLAFIFGILIMFSLLLLE